MPIRFQADYDFNHRIIRAVRTCVPAIDFQTAHRAQLIGLPDREVLSVAAFEGRILVSHDVTTMPSHFAAFITQQNSPGVLLIPQSLSISRAVEDLVIIWSASEPEEYANTITWLPL
ncbi:MAG: DUF5615 family PIN-like protein [Acidobacteria bacterium]|nr:DUF5615 family PIN-like protein [Acidobacteriota bacterium]MBI3422829.1 DUF5615 family PIN-like protein [Acidobacteriota bacterium]